MRRFLMVAALTAGCKGGGAPDPFDPDAIAELPGWIEAELRGQEDACAPGAENIWYRDDVYMATTFFAGDYAWDGDALYGNEFWVIYPNDAFAATGFQPCTVVWDVFGTRGDPVKVGSYSVSLSLLVDEEQTDCLPNPSGVHIYVGEEQGSVTYDVLETGSSATVFFSRSGERLGYGEANNRGFSWLSDKNCMIF